MKCMEKKFDSMIALALKQISLRMDEEKSDMNQIIISSLEI